MPKYTYLRTEILPCEIVLANYSKACVGGELNVVLKREADGEIVFCQTLQIESCEPGKLQQVADLEILLDVPKLTGNCKCSLELCLKEGKNVFYTPKAECEHFRNAIKTQFTNAYAFEIPDETEPFYTVFFLI